MFNATSIITAGSDLVGWVQPNSGTQLSDHFLTSDSGLYVSDLSAIDYDIIEDALSDDYANINNYLQRVHESEILNLMYEFTSKVKSQLGSRDLLNNFDVTNGVTDYTDLATKNARFVGWVIKPHESNNIRATIGNIGLQLSTAETVRIYLYETSQQTAIAYYDFSYTTPLSLQWKAVTDFIVNYRGDYGTNQQYLLGYYENDPNNSETWMLQNQAVQYNFDCGCSDTPKRHFGKFVEIQPIAIPNGYLQSDFSLPDMNDITSYYTDVSYGLFAKVNVTCEITEVLVDNILTFANAYRYRIAVRILDDYLSTVRLNPVSDAKQNRAMAEKARNIYWNTLQGWVDSSNHKHRGLMEDLSIDFSRMDNICLPCDQKVPRTGYINYGR